MLCWLEQNILGVSRCLWRSPTGMMRTKSMRSSFLFSGFHSRNFCCWERDSRQTFAILSLFAFTCFLGEKLHWYFLRRGEFLKIIFFSIFVWAIRDSLRFGCNMYEEILIIKEQYEEYFMHHSVNHISQIKSNYFLSAYILVFEKSLLPAQILV